MKKHFTFFCLLFFFVAGAQVRQWEWLSSSDPHYTNNDANAAIVAADGTGHEYILGTSYDASFAIISGDTVGGNMFLMRYDSSGNALWTRSARGTNVINETGLC